MSGKATGLHTSPLGEDAFVWCAGQFGLARRSCGSPARTKVGGISFCLPHGAKALADSLAEWLIRAGVTGSVVER